MISQPIEKIRGMFLPLPTTFLEDGSLDEGCLRGMVNDFIGAGVHALFLFGSFGQGAAMDIAMRKRGLEIVVSESKGRVPLVAQVGAVDPYTSVELGRHAKDLGVDAIGMVGPYYYSDRSQDEIAAHVRFVHRQVGLPILLYNNPRYSGYSIAPPFLARLVRETPAIFGAKLAMGGVDEALSYRDALPEGFKLFCLASALVPGMSRGVAGTISPPLALAPELGVSLIRAIDEGQSPRAIALQEQVLEFHGAVMALLMEHGRVVFEEGLRLRGFRVRQYPRWPHDPLPAAARERLTQAMEGAGVKLARVAA